MMLSPFKGLKRTPVTLGYLTSTVKILTADPISKGPNCFFQKISKQISDVKTLKLLFQTNANARMVNLIINTACLPKQIK